MFSEISADGFVFTFAGEPVPMAFGRKAGVRPNLTAARWLFPVGGIVFYPRAPDHRPSLFTGFDVADLP
jgi:hypothetical protein